MCILLDASFCKGSCVNSWKQVELCLIIRRYEEQAKRSGDVYNADDGDCNHEELNQAVLLESLNHTHWLLPLLEVGDLGIKDASQTESTENIRHYGERFSEAYHHVAEAEGDNQQDVVGAQVLTTLGNIGQVDALLFSDLDHTDAEDDPQVAKHGQKHQPW